VSFCSPFPSPSPSFPCPDIFITKNFFDEKRTNVWVCLLNHQYFPKGIGAFQKGQSCIIITSPCPKTRAWGAVDRQYFPKGIGALQKGQSCITITSPCPKTRAWGAVDRQYFLEGLRALSKGLGALPIDSWNWGAPFHRRRLSWLLETSRSWYKDLMANLLMA